METSPTSAVPASEPGFVITEHGTLRFPLDGVKTTYTEVTLEYLQAAIVRLPKLERELEDAKNHLKYSSPSNYAPEMIALLEAKAGVADMQNGNQGMAAAYSDAARMLRKALK